ncbi:MAG TPA: hypothetical protein PLH49_03200, partial [Chitinophagaceae bacterium]|nr:hypothetical protein [Chitinophagaceae bacterium]
NMSQGSSRFVSGSTDINKSKQLFCLLFFARKHTTCLKGRPDLYRDPPDIKAFNLLVPFFVKNYYMQNDCITNNIIDMKTEQ